MVDSTALKDFLQLFEPGTPLAVLAVRAPVGLVTGAVADTFDVRRIVEDGPKRTTDDPPKPKLWSSIVGLRDDPWTFVHWAADDVPPEVQAGLCLLAAELTESFATEALALFFSVEAVWDLDTELEGPVSSFAAYDRGEIQERAVVSSSGEVLLFESPDADRTAPADGSSDLELMDRALVAREIVLPGCAPGSSGEDGFLVAADKTVAGRIVRVDLVEGRLCLATDEETLDMTVDGPPPGREAPPAGPSPAPKPASEEATSDEDDDDTRYVMPDELEPAPGFFRRLRGWIGRALGSSG